MWGETANKGTNKTKKKKDQLNKLLSSIKFMRDLFKISKKYLSNFLGL